MSLATDYPVIETGDLGTEFESWRLTGVSEENSDRGRLYVTATATQVDLYKDVFRQPADLVASAVVGAGAVGTFAPIGSSLIGGTVKRNGSAASASITVFVWLASGEDLREFDDFSTGMMTEDEMDFVSPLREMMRQFLLAFASDYPPPPGLSAPLRFVGSPVEQGRSGDPEITAGYFWTLSEIGEYELTGLQNAKDYRSWAIYKTLEIIYDRKARGEEGDPIFARARFFESKAAQLWFQTRPWVDISRNTAPDRQPKIRSTKLRRG